MPKQPKTTERLNYRSAGSKRVSLQDAAGDVEVMSDSILDVLLRLTGYNARAGTMSDPTPQSTYYERTHRALIDAGMGRDEADSIAAWRAGRSAPKRAPEEAE